MDISNRSLNDTYNDVHEVDFLNNIWTEPRSNKGSTESLFNCL